MQSYEQYDDIKNFLGGCEMDWVRGEFYPQFEEFFAIFFGFFLEDYFFVLFICLFDGEDDDDYDDVGCASVMTLVV